MLILIAGIICLLAGYLVYSKFVSRIFIPYKSTTPAIENEDGMDFVPMSKWRNYLIQLLNIAGTGPIFGALMGAKWGPIVIIWIVAGTIFGGAVHDYMVGMTSMRNGGLSATGLVKKYLGGKTRYPILILMIFLLIMVSATFARSASDLLMDLTGLHFTIWLVVILIYFILSTLLPINQVIGRLYPIFGVLLILMAVTVISGIWVEGYEFPTITLENLHPTGKEYFPDMFITVACGAISGFHATQSPLVSRCLKDEKDGRAVFYGSMVLESVIAMVWALAGLAFYGDTSLLADALTDEGSSGVVYDIATGVAGTIGGALAILGVIICPITSGDTALRAARLMISDDRGYSGTDKKISIIIVSVLLVFIVILCTLDFTVLWNYFSWLNQTFACIMLWTVTAFILLEVKNKWYSLITALPAIFMTVVVSSFILYSKLGLSMSYDISVMLGVLIAIIATLVFVKALLKKGHKDASAGTS